MAGTTTTSLYQLYGFTLESELQLPEVLPADPCSTPQARVRLGDVDPDGIADGSRIGPFAFAGPRAIWFDVPNVARFLVEDGEQVVVDPYREIDEDSVRVFLLGSALGALLL